MLSHVGQYFLCMTNGDIALPSITVIRDAADSLGKDLVAGAVSIVAKLPLLLTALWVFLRLLVKQRIPISYTG